MPVAVSGLGEVTAIAAGTYHSLALLSNGTVMAWGSNDSGELGDEEPRWTRNLHLRPQQLRVQRRAGGGERTERSHGHRGRRVLQPGPGPEAATGTSADDHKADAEQRVCGG